MESSLVTSEIVPRANAQRVRELDGVRALAVLSVIASHLLAVTPVLTHTASGLPAGLETVVMHGWLGVDLFFVLSGLLITSILLGTKGKGAGAYFGRFYERRALRILPLYLLLLVILALAYVPQFGAAYFYLCLAFAANLAPLAHVAPPNGGGPLWSLAVEEQFYLVWPVLVLLLDRRKLTVVLIALLAAEPVLRVLHPHDIELTWLRCDGLAAGALLALWFTSPRRTRRGDDRLALGLAVATAALVVLTVPLGGLEPGPVSTALRITEAIGLFAALIVFAVSRAGSRVTASLRVPFAILTADLSYCLYLVHVPLIDAYQTLTARYAPQLASALGPLGANLLRAAVVVTAAYALALFSRHYVELPFLRMGRTRSRPARIGAAPASS